MSRITKDNIATMSPSELLRCALTDLMRCNNDPDYQVTMNGWHIPFIHGEDKCGVCLAGAVMAQSLGANISRWMRPDNYKDEIDRRLVALDFLRLGLVGSAFIYFRFSASKGAKFDRCITPWEASSTSFLVQMFQLADDLDAAGY